MFICGSRSFRHQDEDENGSYGSPCSTPKRSKRSISFSRFIGKDSSSKNPYAGRGLDKFSALLADLDDKRQKIYTQKGSEDIAFVQFAYSTDSKHLKPIVVKVKKKKNNNNKNFLKHLSNSNTITANPVTLRNSLAPLVPHYFDISSIHDPSNRDNIPEPKIEGESYIYSGSCVHFIISNSKV